MTAGSTTLNKWIQINQHELHSMRCGTTWTTRCSGRLADQKENVNHSTIHANISATYHYRPSPVSLSLPLCLCLFSCVYVIYQVVLCGKHNRRGLPKAAAPAETIQHELPVTLLGHLKNSLSGFMHSVHFIYCAGSVPQHAWVSCQWLSVLFCLGVGETWLLRIKAKLLKK